MPRPPFDPATIESMRVALSCWYAAHGRPLAFRERVNGWAVLVSEVMAQQTQVARVEPAWRAFLVTYPTPAALAAASPADALRSWAGMGYNRRALALRAAAATIVARHAGAVPRDVGALEALPGVGPYTARAVAAIAFGVPAAAVDTNIRRVVGRLLGLDPADGASRPQRPAAELQAAADGLVDPDDPGRWTHAMMDLGATVCRPSRPSCERCPLAAWCRWTALGADAQGAADPGPARAASPTVPFPATRRWLRGRIVARLRDQPDGAWLALDGAIGEHDAAAVRAALAALATEGIVEQRPDGRVRLPSTRA